MKKCFLQEKKVKLADEEKIIRLRTLAIEGGWVLRRVQILLAHPLTIEATIPISNPTSD